MYRMIIAEDERNIREAIVRFVNWQEIGFSIAGTFSTGEEALQFVCENNVDAVLTDVRMASLDGLELINILNRMNPGIKFVILSGYDDFTYAQKALRSGVYDYIVKPIKFKQLSDTFVAMKAVMDRERENNSALKQAFSLLREQFLNNLVKGFYLSDEDVLAKSQELDLDLKGERYWLARVEADFYYSDAAFTEDKGRLKDSIRSILEAVTGKLSAGFVFSNDIPELAIFIKGLDNSEQVIEMLEGIKSLAFDSLKQKITIALSSCFQRLTESSEAYKEAGRGLECKLFALRHNVIIPASKTNTRAFAGIFDELNPEAVISLLNSEDTDGIRKMVFGEYARLLDNGGITRESIYFFYTCFMLILSRYLRSMGRDIENLVAGEKLKWMEIDEFKSPEEIPGYICMLYEAVIGINRKSNRAERKIIGKVKEYINEHYNEDISLETLSKKVYMNYSYFSRLFKAETGESFTEYLTRVRIKNAMRMLKETNMKIYEISELVGYSNYRHFAEVFKKAAGCNAIDYRESAEGKSSNL